MSAIRKAALDYASRGWPVFRLSGYKTPFKGTHGHLDATTDPEEIEAWWQETPWANVGLATGDIVVFDADGIGGQAQLDALQRLHGTLPPTAAVRTARGFHYYFRAPDGLEIKGNNEIRPKGRDGLDIKAHGGYVVLPPSINKKANFRYEWAADRPVANMPRWLADYALGRCKRVEIAIRAVDIAWNLGTVPAYCRGAERAERWLESQKRAETPTFLRALKALGPLGPGYDRWFSIGAAIYDFDSGADGLAIFKAVAWQHPDYQTPEAQSDCERKWGEYAKRHASGGLRKSKDFIYREAAKLLVPQQESTKHEAPHEDKTISNASETIFRKPKPVRFIDFDKEGEPRGTTTNAGIALEMLDIECRKDTFHEKMLVGGHAIQAWAGDLSDDVVHMLRKAIKHAYGFDPGEKNMRDAAIQLCLENQFNPVVDYLAALQWDGIPRIGCWVVRYLAAPDTALNREFGRLMLIAAVRRARYPGSKFDQIVVLEGREGTGKSSAIKILAGEDNFSDQNILAAGDKEQQEAFCGVWLHEIAELAGMRRTDVERIKQFASRTEDRARPAYGRIRVDMKRRGIFIATTNETTYLKSETGNRRFWPMGTGQIDLEGLTRDRDQLWAEAAKNEASGTSVVLDERFRALADEVQSGRMEGDLWAEAVINSVKGKSDTSVQDILTNGHFHMALNDIGQVEQNRVARILKRLAFTRYQTRIEGERVWRYRK